MTNRHVPAERQRVDLRSVWERYGGGDIPATLAGLVAATGTLILLAGLAAAGAGTFAVQFDTIDIDGAVTEFSVLGAAAAIVTLFVSFFVGGWVAGRMARFDGGRNGVIVALWMLLLIVVFGALGTWAGSEYNVFARIDLPDWASQLDSDEAAIGASIAAGVAALAMFAGGYLGGMVGEAYNRRVDAALVNAPTTTLVEGDPVAH